MVGGQLCALDLKVHQSGQDNSRILSNDDSDWAEKEVKQQSVTENCNGKGKGKGKGEG